MHETVVEHRLYIIDFNTSRQFALGPGVQRAITLPGAQLEPPNGLEHFDPYSWDVYCAGRTLEIITEVCYIFVQRSALSNDGHTGKISQEGGKTALARSPVHQVVGWERTRLHRRVPLSPDGAYGAACGAGSPVGCRCAGGLRVGH